MSIADNVEMVKKRIETAARKCGRDPNSIKLIAVSKTKAVEEILEAVAAGLLAFGENYAQELRDKAKEIENALSPSPLPLSHQGRGNNVDWHFVGHLQKNKLKYVLPVASWIHTIDSAELLEEIMNRVILNEAKDPPNTIERMGSFSDVQDDRQINCLIEVNLAGESNKSGCTPENVFKLVKVFSHLHACTPARLHVCTPARLHGLMCIPPLSDDAKASRPYFKNLWDLLNEINSRNIYSEKLTELSMGMSHDFEVAIEEGATMIRIGTAIFGNR